MNEIITTILIVAGLGLAGLWLKLTVRPGSSRESSARVIPSPILTNHAKQRMVEREISSLQIDLVIAEPTRERADVKNDSVRLERTITGRTLIVWVAKPWPAAETIVKSTAWADATVEFTIPAGTAGRVIGRGGTTIRRIESDYRVRVSIGDGGSVRVTSGSKDSVDAAQREILTIVNGTASATSPLLAA